MGFLPAKYPIFEGANDRKLRELLGLLLLCDVYIKRMSGVGFTTLYEKITKGDCIAYNN